MDFTVYSINISPAKGTAKEPVDSAEVAIDGIRGDAHSGNWHRQISLLDQESVLSFSEGTGLDISPGDFGENITIQGIDITLLTPGSRISGPEGLLLEVTQVGKECHGDRCDIYTRVGKCIMPARGVFCRVIGTGHLHRGDILRLLKKNETP
jgi:MOSC domain-containing protein YiiM